MPTPTTLLKAQMQPISWDDQGQVSETGEAIAVQFNPESLKVAYANKSAGGDQRGGSAVQFVGSGTTKLTLDLWFDVTAAAPDRPAGDADDVRRLTEKVVNFIKPEPSDEADKFVPPGMRFLWGTFLFEGVVESINESLEFFSEAGKPLRAKLGLSIASQDIQFVFGAQSADGVNAGPATPGARPVASAREGDSVQQAAAREGRQDDWQSIADNNDIDNPRALSPGQPLDMSR